MRLMGCLYHGLYFICQGPGEGVGVSVSGFLEDTIVVEVDYCAYSELRRPNSCKNESFTAGNFEVLTKITQIGITYFANKQLG